MRRTSIFGLIAGGLLLVGIVCIGQQANSFYQSRE
jgi:hypothetical protein